MPLTLVDQRIGECEEAEESAASASNHSHGRFDSIVSPSRKV